MPANDLRRDFADRAALEAYLRAQFTESAARDGHLSPFPGGRSAALAAAQSYDARKYEATRNYLDGAVSRLSMYIRHGLLSLAELRPNKPYKFVQELAWRDYWRRLYAEIGDDVWQNQEDYKTGHQTYAAQLPPDIASATTGLACMDAFSRELRETGYLHNHARMWFAAYLVHWRRAAWQAGARWFLTHLVDGDPASNNLSWQWVASTFSHKPYFFNRENLERYTRSSFCNVCPKRHADCPFDSDYPTLEERLFRIA